MAYIASVTTYGPVVTQNLTSGEVLTIGGVITSDGGPWYVLSYTGCTVSQVGINSGDGCTITPTSGSTSYSVELGFYTEVSTESTIISGTISESGSDTTPDQFTFTDVTGASVSTVYTSTTVTVTGLSPNISVTLTSTGGTLDAGTSSLSGTFTSSKTVTTSSTGTLVLAARVTSSASNSTAASCTVTIGSISDTYTVTTGAPATDTTPDQFTFTDQNGVARSTIITSNTITVSGINSSAAISITNGTYSKNGGAYTSTAGTVVNGNTISVRHTSSSLYSTATNTTLTIGGVSDTFTSTTIPSPATDTTPDQFTFVDQINVGINSTISSNSITVSGINAAASISVTNGTYSIDGGSYISTPSTIANGQGVSVRHTSSSSYGTSVTTTLTIGGISDAFTSTTSSTAVSPTYSIVSTTSNEGTSKTIVVNTTNVSNGTVLYWTMDSSASADVYATSGSFIISANTGSFDIGITADSVTEGTEYYIISIKTGSINGTVVSSGTLTINDTSQGSISTSQYGLQIYNSLGTIIIDTSARLPRFAGAGVTATVLGTDTVVVPLVGMNNTDEWSILTTVVLSSDDTVCNAVNNYYITKNTDSFTITGNLYNNIYENNLIKYKWWVFRT